MEVQSKPKRVSSFPSLFDFGSRCASSVLFLILQLQRPNALYVPTRQIKYIQLSKPKYRSTFLLQ